MGRFINLSCLIALTLAVSDSEQKVDGPLELKCGKDSLEFDESVKKGNEDCDAKIFGEMKKDPKIQELEKKEKPTEADVKEMNEKWKENFELHIKPKIWAVCKAKALNLVDPDGKIIKEAHAKLLQKNIKDKDLAAKLIAATEKCIDSQPVLFKEDTCTKDNEALMAHIKCIADASKKVCGDEKVE